MAINWNNNVNENSEKAKVNNSDSIEKFMDNYLDNKNISNTELDVIFSENNNTFLKDLKDYLKSKNEKNEFLWLKIESNDVIYIKNKLFPRFVILNWKRTSLEKSFYWDYEFSSSEKSRLQNEIKSLSDKELEKLIDTDNISFDKSVTKLDNRNKFLKKIFSDSLPTKLEKTTFNNHFNYLNTDKAELVKIFNKDPELKKVLQTLDDRKIDEPLTNNESDCFLYLIKTNLLSNDQKKRFILDFLPEISFDTAVKLNLISDIKKFKIDILKKYYGDNISEINHEDILKNDIYFENISISTYDLLKNDSSLLSQEEFLKLFADKYCVAYNYELKSKLSKIDSDLFSFKLNLDRLQNVEWWLNFWKWAYLVIEKELLPNDSWDDNKWKKPKESNYSTSYIKIVSDWSPDWSTDWIVKFYDLWTWKIVMNSKTENDTNYEDLLKFLKSWNEKTWVKSVKKCSVLTEDELRKKIVSWDIKESLDKLDLIDETELDRIISSKESELSKLKQQREDLKKQSTSSDNIKVIDDEISSLQNSINKDQELNLKLLKEELRQIDKWFDNYNFRKWTTFSTKKSNWESFYRIENIDSAKQWWQIIISDFVWNNYPAYTFLQFLQAFKSEIWFLTSDVTEFKDVFTKMNEDDDKIKWIWDKFKYSEKNQSIVKKSTNNDEKSKWTNIEYDFLVADSKSWKWNEVIKIHSINWDKVIVSEWECIEYKYTDAEIKKDKNLESKTKNEFSMNSKTYTISVWELHSRIKKYKLVPKSTNEHNDIETDNITNKDIKWSFISRFLNNYSIKDVLAGWKIWIDSITAYLKQTEDEHSARFANSVFGSFLPQELKNDLQTRLESAQMKRQNDYTQKLKDVDSSDATKMILWRLQNKNSPEYKKEAWMIFMLEKYWVLYAKWLNDKKWSFLWYEAMWWKIGDKLYMQEKAKAEEADVPFTEEQLLFVLIFLQCTWKANPKRRSRLHKDYNKFRNQWKEEEFKTWETDAWAKRTLKWRVEYVFWELNWWTYANARWWYEKVIDKWWSMKEMNEVPFVVLFSWLSYTYEESVLDKWKDMVTKWKLIPLTQYLWNKSKMDVFNNTVLEICRIVSEEKWNDMYKEAKAIFDTQKKVEWDGEKIKRTREFYKKYGDLLTNALNMLHNSDKWDDSKYSDIIITHIEDRTDKNWKQVKGNQVFKDYLNVFHWWNEFVFDNDDYMTDAFHSAWTFWMDPEKATIQALALASWPTLKKWKIAPILWNEIITWFHAKAIRSYDNEKDRINAMKHDLRWMVAWMLHNGWAWWLLPSYNSETFLFSRMNDWWVYLDEIWNQKLTIENIKSKKNHIAEKLLDKWVDQIIEYEKNNKSHKRNKNDDLKTIKDEIPSITDETKNVTNKVLNNSKYLPNNID